MSVDALLDLSFGRRWTDTLELLVYGLGPCAGCGGRPSADGRPNREDSMTEQERANWRALHIVRERGPGVTVSVRVNGWEFARTGDGDVVLHAPVFVLMDGVLRATTVTTVIGLEELAEVAVVLAEHPPLPMAVSYRGADRRDHSQDVREA